MHDTSPGLNARLLTSILSSTVPSSNGDSVTKDVPNVSQKSAANSALFDKFAVKYAIINIQN